MSHVLWTGGRKPTFRAGTMLLALTGWMDGGDVSTGTIGQIMRGRSPVEVARIDPRGFYIESFPASMEMAALLRPHVRYVGGLIEAYETASNLVRCDPGAELAFFSGREPHLEWGAFADAVYEAAHALAVSRIIFVGSFGGAVPHTREPRLYGSVSHRHLLDLLHGNALRPSSYEGPASFATHLLSRAPREEIEMLSLVAEIPGYLQGTNPMCIAAVCRRLARILRIPIDVESLRQAATDWELRVTEAVADNDELASTIRSMEEQYDSELIETPDRES